jgi:hypothetical protein
LSKLSYILEIYSLTILQCSLDKKIGKIVYCANLSHTMFVECSYIVVKNKTKKAHQAMIVVVECHVLVSYMNESLCPPNPESKSGFTSGFYPPPLHISLPPLNTSCVLIIEFSPL